MKMLISDMTAVFCIIALLVAWCYWTITNPFPATIFAICILIIMALSGMFDFIDFSEKKKVRR